MTHDEFRQQVLQPFVTRHGVVKAAALLGKRKDYISRVVAGRRNVTQALAGQFGQKLVNAAEGRSVWRRHCPDCDEVTYHRRVYMEQFLHPAVQCSECLTIEIQLHRPPSQAE